jgi:hypothetical protein
MPFVSLLFAVVPLVILAAIVLGAIALVQRREPDPTGRRPYLLYLLLVVFLALATMVTSGSAFLGSAGELVFDGAQSPRGEIFLEGVQEFPNEGRDSEKATRSDLVQAALLLIAGLLLYRFHAPRLDDLMASDPKERAFERTHNVYLYVVCFTAAVVTFIAGAVAIQGLLKAILPGTLSSAPDDIARDQGFVQILRVGSLAGASAYLFLVHWRKGEPARRGAVADTGGDA